MGDTGKNCLYSHAFSGWNNAVHRLSRLKRETREFDCRREMSHSFPFSNYLIIVTKSVDFIDPCHFSNGKRGNVTYFFSLFNLFFMMRYYFKNSLSRRSLVSQCRPPIILSSPFLLHVVYYSGETSVEMRYVLYVQCWEPTSWSYTINLVWPSSFKNECLMTDDRCPFAVVVLFLRKMSFVLCCAIFSIGLLYSE